MNLTDAMFLFLCVCLFANGWLMTKTNALKPKDLKFDLHVPWDSPGMTLYKISEKGAGHGQSHVTP